MSPIAWCGGPLAGSCEKTAQFLPEHLTALHPDFLQLCLLEIQTHIGSADICFQRIGDKPGLNIWGDLVLISKAFGSDSTRPLCFIDAMEIAAHERLSKWQVVQDVCRFSQGRFGVGKGVDPTWGWICFGLPNPSSLLGVIGMVFI
ncbi:hypothetical protein NC653_037167 [Populus alba x Populus x berolinensis]|uniref:Uncharacterized protein n=1 Tax=Populus alba x Populus x berolinensis TaxID=444605 RepID=A0AAD6PSM9_9ROSI|nr:hypothetical protein NC653_037167 [Populus alba x Populus x berolinensis]